MPAVSPAWDTASTTNTPSAATAPCLTRKESGTSKMPEKPTPQPCPTSTCSAADFPARLSALLDAARDSETPVAPSSLNLPAWLNDALDRLGYGVEWQVLNSKDFGVPQSRRRAYIVGYLDDRCRGKILPFTETAGTSLAQIQPGTQGERIYSPTGVSCTLSALAGGFGGRTGLYAVGLPIKEATRKGYKIAYPGDSIDISYYSTNTRRGRVGHKIAHTL